jgi:shikimate dehydrogenase
MLSFDQCLLKIKKIKKNSYCLIIGGIGTNKARSPKIWNKVFKKNKFSCKMIPLEIYKKDLNKLLAFLKKDKKFLGGAVTFPYKENVFKFLGNNVDSSSKKIGSINCLYKEKNLRGINTDGIGFYETLKRNRINKKLKVVLQLGYGGAGKSTLVFLKKYFSKQTLIYCSSRKNLSRKIKNAECKWIQWNKKKTILNECNMLVNTTSLGFSSLKNRMPCTINKTNQLQTVYDIIYKPKKTLLIEKSKNLKIQTINGLEMNLLQAHFAIKKVFKSEININI